MLSKISQYLKETLSDGLILTPDETFNFECFVDANFAGLYLIDEILDQSIVKSQTNFVITISGCPIL